jgi:hypothetical protein
MVNVISYSVSVIKLTKSQETIVKLNLYSTREGYLLFVIMWLMSVTKLIQLSGISVIR